MRGRERRAWQSRTRFFPRPASTHPGHGPGPGPRAGLPRFPSLPWDGPYVQPSHPPPSPACIPNCVPEPHALSVHWGRSLPTEGPWAAPVPSPLPGPTRLSTGRPPAPSREAPAMPALTSIDPRPQATLLLLLSTRKGDSHKTALRRYCPHREGSNGLLLLPPGLAVHDDRLLRLRPFASTAPHSPFPPRPTRSLLSGSVWPVSSLLKTQNEATQHSGCDHGPEAGPPGLRSRPVTTTWVAPSK